MSSTEHPTKEAVEVLRGFPNHLAGGTVSVMHTGVDEIILAISDSHGDRLKDSYRGGDTFQVGETEWLITEIVQDPRFPADAAPGSGSGTVAARIEQVTYLPRGVILTPEMEQQVHDDTASAHKSAMTTPSGKQFAYDVQTQPKPVVLRILLLLAGFIPVPWVLWDLSTSTSAELQDSAPAPLIALATAVTISWWLISLANKPDEVRLIVPTEPRSDLP